MSSRPKPLPPTCRIEFPPALPISARADEIIGLLQKHQVLVLAGETGSGKTTQIPKMALAAGGGTRGRIACTQPRRVAATSVSRRVAEEMNVSWGREVGCKIRFADQTSEATVIKFMTDGMLLAELQADPLLREYDTIIVDEAHERSLNIDFILGHLRRLCPRRPELRVIITSATIDTAAFAEAFGGAPVVEVSGRLFPVEVVWSPLDELKGDRDEFTYLDGVVEAVERILTESRTGDLLVFLPTERDIREVCDLLDGGRAAHCEIVPLFGRLTNAEQQRVFAPVPHRKIVVATNIAETSLTIPGIRFVVDTGLARLSRYAPQSRTRRLPVEPVSRSAADQRKGRCGRVSDGICIRLYSEQDYETRPRFTPPEIQRANLADVILRMKAFGLGDIEDFPFLNAPPARAVKAGYALLHELGALDDAGVLTPLGEELARLPVDPTVGRMILQARTEKALREVLIIASALSIQDPRERPLEKQREADAAHRRFAHADSDFLALLAIWEIYHDEFERLTLGKLRKFCTAHFLSFPRMREWRDIHAQLEEMVAGLGNFSATSVRDGLRADRELDLTFGASAYRAIHRSILAGLLGNVATRHHDGSWHATHDRRVAVFPGSALFERTQIKRKNQNAPATKPKSNRWLMAAEIMETGRVYARTAARIEPGWLDDLAAHLIRISHTEPFWSAEAGRVLVKERRRLHNLELQTRSVGYGKINSRHATEIFIREGLVADTITWPFDCLAHNRRLRESTEAVLTRTRSAGYLDLDEAAYRFYAARLLPVEQEKSGGGEFVVIASVPEFVDLVRHRRMTEPKFLFMNEADLRPPAELAEAAREFPPALPLENRALPLHYAYRPGQDDDGVTLRVNLAEAEKLTPARLDWAVPGHLAEKVELLLKALPKELRRGLIPLADTARAVCVELALPAKAAEPPPLTRALAAALSARLGRHVDVRLWDDKPLPEHLCVRVEVVDADDTVLAASRDLDELRRLLREQSRAASRSLARTNSAEWQAARIRWETLPFTEWKFGDLPHDVLVAETAGVPVRAYLGLQAMEAGVAVRLFATEDEATRASRSGLRALFIAQLRHDLAWLEKDLRELRQLGVLTASLGPLEKARSDAFASVSAWAVSRPVEPLTATAFARELAVAKESLRGLVPQLIEQLREVLALRLELQTHKTPYPGLENDLATLLPADFLRKTPFVRVPHLSRYLRGLKLRAERWRRDPAKDSNRARELQPFVQAVQRLGDRATELRWLVEEFRISLFAQELGTAESVSAVRLEKAVREAARMEELGSSPSALAPAALPLGSSGQGGTGQAVAPRKTVLRSFEALGNL